MGLTLHLVSLHGTRMSFAARGYKSHMLFAPLEWPYSDKMVAA